MTSPRFSGRRRCHRVSRSRDDAPSWDSAGRSRSISAPTREARAAVARGVLNFCQGHTILNFACTVNAHVSNKTPSGTYRGPGRVEAKFFRERLIDMAAEDLRIDPADIRRRNFVTAQEMPFNIGKLVNYEPPAQLDSGDFGAVFEQALNEIGGSGSIPCKVVIEGRSTASDCFLRRERRGGAEETSTHWPQWEWEPRCVCRLYKFRTGPRDGFAQVCPNALHLPLDQIRIICASTDELQEGFGTWHSRSAVMSGNAVCTMAQVFIDQLEWMASEYFGWPNVELMAQRTYLPQRHGCEGKSGSAGTIRNGPRQSRRCDRGVRVHRSEAIQLRHPRGPRDSRSAHRRSQQSIHRHRGYRSRAQSIGRARSGAGRDRTRSGGTFWSTYATTRPDNCSPPRSPTTCCRPRPTSPTSVAISWSWRWPLEIHSAPKARAKAALWRWLPQSATPFPLRCRRFACRYASCRYRRRAFGNSSKIRKASLNKRRTAMMLSRLRPLFALLAITAILGGPVSAAMIFKIGQFALWSGLRGGTTDLLARIVRTSCA